MHADIERALAQLDEAEKKYEQLITANRAKLNERPRSGGWSIAENVDHCNVIARELVGPLKEVVHAAKAKGKMSDKPHRPGFVGKYMTRTMEPPAKKKMKTQKIYEPSSNIDPNTLLEQYKDVHNTFKQLMRESDGVDLTRVKMASPAMKILKLNLGDWYFFIAAHERRHLWQAEKVAKGL